ncbi:thiol-disulfide oxidoreductase DCC family protein [Marinobacter sp. SBS5]|uniref:thiol-disulfide oxidoreductase DCC family protein n=1 Tax=Marinobacter sp. SBS5 TaxID=3401754 RepID=UPI003AAA50DD
MAQAKEKLLVFYDGACPTCIRDRRWYEKLAGQGGDSVGWLDITGREEELRAQGVDPDKALRELHVKDSSGTIHQEMDAYILLMSRVPVLKPLAWLIGLPIIRPCLAALYHRWVARRLSERLGS